MADFTLTNYSKVEESTEYKTLITRFENGSEQRRNKWGSALKTFHVTYQNRPESEADDLRTFFDNEMGAYGTFTFKKPNDSTEYTVRFATDTLEIKRIAYDAYDISFDLKEVR